MANDSNEARCTQSRPTHYPYARSEAPCPDGSLGWARIRQHTHSGNCERPRSRCDKPLSWSSFLDRDVVTYLAVIVITAHSQTVGPDLQSGLKASISLWRVESATSEEPALRASQQKGRLSMKRLLNKFGVALLMYWFVAIAVSAALLGWSITEATDSVALTVHALVVGASGAISASVLILYTFAKLHPHHS